MELTPQDRQRIYAEEKARSEAQEKLKSEKVVKDFGLGCLVLIVVAGLAFALWPRTDPSKSELMVEPGAIISTKSGYVPVCMDSKDGLDEASQWFGRDNEELARAILKYGGEIIPPGTQVKLLDPGILRTRVRVIASGRECWVVRELVQ